MKAGDVKRFLEKTIDSGDPGSIDPQEFKIHDSYLLGLIKAYRNGHGEAHIKRLVHGYLTTESLTTQRRCAVLNLMSDVLSRLAAGNMDKDDKAQLKELLTAYYV